MDLEKDTVELEKYQREKLVEQLAGLELHLEDIGAGKKVDFCRSCVLEKHVPAIRLLASECVGCRGDIWRKIAAWASGFDLGQGAEILRIEARDFRKRLTSKGGNSMGHLVSSEQLGKKAKSEKQGSILPWIVGLGLALGGWYFYDKKKKARAEAEARQREQERLQEPVEKEYPGRVLTLPEETGLSSASERLKGMGIDLSRPGNYQRGDPYVG